MAQSFRKRVVVWLNLDKPQEANLLDYIEDLKVSRLFSRTIREGLLLIRDLRAGRLDILLDLFPWVEEAFWQRLNVESDIHRSIREMQKEIMAAINDPPRALPAHAGTVPRAKLAPAIEAFDVPELVVTESKVDKENNNPTWNFMIASTLNIYGHCDDLAPEIIAYGVRTKRIPKGAITKATDEKLKAYQTPGDAGQPKVMDVPQFAAPTFDDLEIEI